MSLHQRTRRQLVAHSRVRHSFFSRHCMRTSHASTRSHYITPHGVRSRHTTRRAGRCSLCPVRRITHQVRILIAHRGGCLTRHDRMIDSCRARRDVPCDGLDDASTVRPFRSLREQMFEGIRPLDQSAVDHCRGDGGGPIFIYAGGDAPNFGCLRCGEWNRWLRVALRSKQTVHRPVHPFVREGLRLRAGECIALIHARAGTRIQEEAGG
jgi:hypothetical protein